MVQVHTSTDILRIATAGSVDDGKSTLIGRLLYETQNIPLDKIEAIERASRRRGLDYLDLSLLTDGLIAEREQGITIDVAHIYFSTATRKYIIADTPGHFEYTRNMITGASTAQVAIILVDARNGIVEQTHRHYYITQLLRIPQVVVCVNKMDLVNYSRQQFEVVVQEFEALKGKAQFTSQEIAFIPVSSLLGENIACSSSEMPWYRGPSLLQHLESITWKRRESQQPARFPVQFVIRPKNDDFHDFRGFAGKVASGVFRTGEPVAAFPSLQESRIAKIYRNGKEVELAQPGESVVITLEDDIDLSRGDMLLPLDGQIPQCQEFNANLCWMDEAPLKLGGIYQLQHGANRVKAKVINISHTVNPVDLQTHPSAMMRLNEIGLVRVKTAKPIAGDAYSFNKNNGAFILIEEGSNHTVAVGFIEN
ncbi:MAG: sulfate adenylyltransferase subunit 1 [Saprospiraceae bacterium]